MYSLDLSKKISSALQTRTRNGTRLPVNARYGYKKGTDGSLEVDPEAAKVVKMIFQMAAEGGYKSGTRKIAIDDNKAKSQFSVRDVNILILISSGTCIGGRKRITIKKNARCAATRGPGGN